MKKVTYFMLVATLGFAACSNDEKIESIDNGPVELRLTSGIDVQQTRATHDLDERLGLGETVYVWVDDVEDGPLYEKIELTRGAGPSNPLTGEETMYFPQNGNGVDIYALHTNADLDEVTEYPDEVLEHQVAADQRNTTDGYATSDLVYAKREDVSRQREAVELTFKHLLSKVEVVLKAGVEGVLDDISNLELVDLRYRAEFTLDKGSEADEINVTPVTGFGTRADIEIDTDITGDEGNEELNEAIIVPQEVSQGTPFIRITLDDGSEFIYNMATATTFESGKKYKYIITANPTGLDVTSSITNWEEGDGDDNGSAEMVDPD